MKNKKLLTRIGLFACSLLCASTALAGPYVDKHGNSSDLFLGPPLVGYSFNAGIDITVQYVANDSNGGATGKYRITSQYLPGRGPTDDFVLNVMVTNDATQRGAELVIRNNADVAPIAPIVRLLDCSTTPCSEDKRLENEIWGAFVIQDQDDVASYPIELLDARAISQFLDPSFLAQLPNNGDGSGNWKEILENHRLNFQESKFRMDIDHLGEAQSDLLTSRMIAEFPIADASGKDWVRKHAEDIQHGALSFLTEHKDLIEDLSEVLVDKHTWPADYSFPFGRMPVWLVNPELDADWSDFRVVPQHWDRVLTGIPALTRPGCYHLFPESGYVPTLSNGINNVGQFECAQATTSNGFADRPCNLESDYVNPGNSFGGIGSELESSWHNPIHGFIGGAFASPTTTAGTVIFWAFHTYASSNVLSNWRHAQRKAMPIPNSNIDPTQLIDVNFLVDTSSSYTDDLPQFKVEVPDLIDDLDTTYDNIHFGLGHYADYPIFPFGDGGAGDSAYARLVDLSPNGSSVKSAISGLTTTSGNDYPESQLVALYQSATGLGQTFAAPYDGANIASGQQSNFRTGAIKVILLFTDADFHRPGDAGPIPYPGPGFDETANAILALDPPMVVGISSGGGGLDDLKEIALATGATAPAGGTDCDGDGVIDIAEGEALVCVSPADSSGIGDILAGVLDSAVEEAEAKETDGDGVQDLRDNCIYDANADQADVDDDGIGDVCDEDNDNDGILDDVDNCPLTSNSQQLDTDGDAAGDLCDDDDDDDGIVDELDACPTLATSQVINGTSGNDTLVGTAGNDMIFGYAGNDEINGGGGDDCIVGGAGDDELIGAEGDDTIFGGAGDDRIHGKVGDDNIYADDGADVVFGCEGFDVIEGGAGDDRLYADGHEASDHGGPIVEEPSCTAPAWRANKAYTGGQTVSYQGEEYTAHYWTKRKKPSNHSGSQSSGKPWSKATSCASSGGGDTGVSLEDFSKCDATAWTANKAYTGGQTVSYQGVEYTAHYWTKGRTPAANSGNQASGKPWSVGESCLSWEAAIAACGDELTDGHGHHGGAHTGGSATPHAHHEETILGGEGNDRIYGGPANDSLDGGAGLDLVCGGAGDDHAMGGPGMDVVVGGSGDDSLAGNTEDDLVIGGLGDDGVSGGVGADWLIGNEGDDVIDGGFHEMGGHGHGHGHDSGVIDTCIGGDGINEFNNCEQISGASLHSAHGSHGHGHDLEPTIDAESLVDMLCAYKPGPQNSSGFPYGYGLTALGLLGVAQWRRRKAR